MQGTFKDRAELNIDKKHVVKVELPKTQRQQLVKLELSTSNIHSQIDKVAQDVYNIEEVLPYEAKDSRTWNFMEEQLYNHVKKGYDNVIQSFASEPHVYKLESVKEKIWADRDETIRRQIEEQNAKIAKHNRKNSIKNGRKNSIIDASSLLAKELIRKQKEDEQLLMTEIRKDIADRTTDDRPDNIDELTDTFIDPYILPLPWKIEMKNGKPLYVNDITKERTTTKPNEVSEFQFLLLVSILSFNFKLNHISILFFILIIHLYLINFCNYLFIHLFIFLFIYLIDLERKIKFIKEINAT